MYDELVKRLRSGRYTLEDLSIILPEAADAIEKLQAQIDGWIEQERNALLKSIPKWIPATDRLPEIDMSYPHHEDYLVQYDSGNMDVASWSNVNRFWTDHVTEPHWNCVQFAEVIAWMPLPEPPKEET